MLQPIAICSTSNKKVVAQFCNCKNSWWQSWLRGSMFLDVFLALWMFCSNLFQSVLQRELYDLLRLEVLSRVTCNFPCGLATNKSAHMRGMIYFHRHQRDKNLAQYSRELVDQTYNVTASHQTFPFTAWGQICILGNFSIQDAAKMVESVVKVPTCLPPMCSLRGRSEQLRRSNLSCTCHWRNR